MSASPSVSIVLPTFNGATYLSCALDAILKQTYSDWELIVVDDGSTDDTPEILARAARGESRIRVLRNPTNRRLPGSLNVGFEASRGQYLTWTSDDNWHRPEAIEALVRHLEECPEVDLVYSDYMTVDEEGRDVERVTVSGQWLLPFGNSVGASFLYRREVFDKLGKYAEDLFLAEDYDYWLRVASSFRSANVARDLYCYRVHDHSLTSQRARQVCAAHTQAIRRNLARLPWLRRPGRALAYFELAHRARQAQDRSGVFRNIFRASLAHPGVLFWRRHWRLQDIVAIAEDDLISPEDQEYLCWVIQRKEGACRLLVYALLGAFLGRLWRRVCSWLSAGDRDRSRLAGDMER